MSQFGRELVQSAKEALAIAQGAAEPAGTYVPYDVDVAAIRKKLGLSQARFAARFGLSAATVRDWEQKRRKPDQIARILLTVIDRDHEAVEKALAG
jgi:putative transcriptional regulator